MRRMWSKNQLTQEVVKGLVNEDIKVKTIESSEANWSGLFNTPTLPTGLEYSENAFKAVKVINGVLWIIAELTIKNTTSSAISEGLIFTCDIPSSIAEHIYRIDGSKVSEAGSGAICAFCGIIKNQPARVYTSSYGANALSLGLGSISYAVGDNPISIRLPIILL